METEVKNKSLIVPIIFIVSIVGIIAYLIFGELPTHNTMNNTTNNTTNNT